MPESNIHKQNRTVFAVPGRPGGGPGGPHMRGPVRKPKNTKGTVKRLWNYMKEEKYRLGGVAFLVLVSTVLNLFGPYFIGVAIDECHIPVNFSRLSKIIGLLIAAYVGATFTTWLQMYIMVGVSQRTLMKLRKDLFSKLQAFSLRFFDSRPHGELMSRLTNDVDNISNVLTQSVTQLISSILTVIGVLVAMVSLNWQLALITILIIPFIATVTQIIAMHARRRFLDQQKNLGILNGFIEEMITGHKVIKAYGREKNTIKKFNRLNTDFRKSTIRAQILAGAMGPLMNVIRNLNFAIVVAAGSWMVLKGIASVGVVASFVSYSRQFARPLNHIATLYTNLQSALAGAERVFEIMDEVPELKDEAGALPLDIKRGEVVFENVNFSYRKGIPVLKNINFKAEPGQMVALIGPTGSGKTTIVNLLARFYDPDSGRIIIDGQDIRKVQKESLRRRLGIVLQDTYLFSGTIRENIRYGRLDASDEEVEEAARLVYANSFIRRLPDGYDTVLSAEGSNLSQGQRQLISIARAILANPDILVLDEATSNVDTRTEIYIQRAMERLMRGRTSFVIAHRLKTIQKADLILVIRDGQIIEKGNHASLIQKKGFYYELYTTQYRKSS